MREQRSEVGDKIAETGELNDETLEALKGACAEWLKQFTVE